MLHCLRRTNIGSNKESRGRWRLAHAYDANGGSQFRAILQLIHHFSDLTAPLTDLLRKSLPQAEITLTHACLEALETLKLRLIPAPCLILPEVSSDATFTGLQMLRQ
jgi:hypothetical protein